MNNENKAFAVKSKIWIEDMEGNVVFGLGRYRILNTISRLGSMNAAAKEMHMSYRAVWMRIRASEERIGKPLVVREGKGSRLTLFAENLIKQFKRMRSVVEMESDEIYEELMSEQLSP
jgi:molybdate transport system regulatory protein